MPIGFAPPPVASTHAENNLGEVLYQAVLKRLPHSVVEFGVLHGYSTLSIAQALRDAGRGHLVSYDLWEDYPYNHGDQKEVQAQLRQLNLESYVSLRKRSFFDWIREPEDFDLMYLDISNDGRIVRTAVAGLATQIANGSVLIFEGGSEERDAVWWMKKFNREPMAPLRSMLGSKLLDSRFPSLSVVPADALD